MFEKIKDMFRLIGGAKNDQPTLTIKWFDDVFERDVPSHGWYIIDGKEILAGPYKTEGAAKGQRTRYVKGYSPASRRPL
jgi:hypothetical protein